MDGFTGFKTAAAEEIPAAVAVMDDASVAKLRGLAGSDELALEQAIEASLAQPVSLAARHQAIELLARARYEDPWLSSPIP